MASTATPARDVRHRPGRCRLLRARSRSRRASLRGFCFENLRLSRKLHSSHISWTPQLDRQRVTGTIGHLGRSMFLCLYLRLHPRSLSPREQMLVQAMDGLGGEQPRFQMQVSVGDAPYMISRLS